METKPIYLSKTFWLNVLAIVVMIVGVKAPAVGEFIKNYFAELGSGWAVLNTVLRIISKDKLSIS